MATTIETAIGPIATIELSPSLMHERSSAPSGPIPAATML